MTAAFLGYIGAGNYFGLDALVEKGLALPAGLRRWLLSGDTLVVRNA